ncbi:mitochondrial-processing peptidase subunit alpha [Anthonomus grandis grandis]|uniref:mitochondrial-processing peptidase subunit alpha n=1 Tax=Anthonomus grandis grandis TaxID=2921223 RepID=UPI0021660552|nr:mitochondrial-processing peptidase subunit alpha [Anthonomus grandis grandis]
MALQASKTITKSILQSKNKLWKTPNYIIHRCTSTEWTNLSQRPKDKVTDMPPMTEPVRNLPHAVYANFREKNQQTKVTTLSNGLRVASENRFGEFCTVGVVIDSGSRYEVAYPSGISHFLEKLAFNSTKHYPDRDEMINKLEKHGGICDSQASRDTFIYAASAYTTGLNDVIQLLAEATLRPQLTLEEIDAARQAISFELETLHMRPEQETILMDMIHAAAYRDNTLGLPKLCPNQNLNKIDRETLFAYLSQHYTPKRMVVAGVGVEHERLVEVVQKHFVDSKPVWETESLVGRRQIPEIDRSIAQYTGGMEQEECDIPQFASSGLPVLSHIMIGLEGCSHQDKEFIAMCVLNMMMGGGGSFSAGGPGKGMYTRLYTNVLNRYHWMFSATAYNHAYIDTGLFCIHASAPSNYVRDMVEVIVREMVNMTQHIGDQELRRAKTQLQSMLLMNLESRPVMFEDIGRQVLATGHRKRPQYFIKEIEKITKDDIVQVAKRLLMSQPSVAARGDLRKLPSLEYIQAGLIDSEGKLPSGRKLSLWR